MTTGAAERADTIIRNVRARTMDPAHPAAQAVALQGDTILAIGSVTDINKLAGDHTLVIDGAGGTLLPGFVESYCHLFLGGSELGNLDLSKTGPDIFSAIRRYAVDTPDRRVLVVQGAD